MPSARLSKQYVSLGLCWLGFYGLLWWLLTGSAGWGFGAVCVLAAAGLSVALGLVPGPLRITALPHFLALFLRELFVGGWDVARRAFHPRLPLDPAWVTYSFHCTEPRVRLMLSALVGLLPGTLSSHYEDEVLHIHTLDQRLSWSATVAQLERALARLLGATS